MSDEQNIVIQPKVTRITMRGGPRVVTLNRETVALIDKHRPKLVTEGNAVVEVQDRRPRITVNGGMGIQGRPGEAEGATFDAVCGEIIHGQRAVRIANGLLYAPDTAIPIQSTQVVGIATTAGVLGETIAVRRGGRMTESYWTWGPGYVYCGADGVLVQPYEATGWLLAVARVIDPQTIDIDIDNPIIRS